jgi:hypothetical protein
VPVSRKRKKAATPVDVPHLGPKKKGRAGRLAPLMLTLFGIGVLWLVVFYITQGDMPLVSDCRTGTCSSASLHHRRLRAVHPVALTDY